MVTKKATSRAARELRAGMKKGTAQPHLPSRAEVEKLSMLEEESSMYLSRRELTKFFSKRALSPKTDKTERDSWRDSNESILAWVYDESYGGNNT